MKSRSILDTRQVWQLGFEKFQNSSQNICPNVSNPKGDAFGA
jgi:hypothetical protein